MSHSVGSLQSQTVSKSIVVNSRDRITGSTSAQNFRTDLSFPGKEKSSKAILSWISIPHTFKNINTNTKQIQMTEARTNTLTLTNTAANPTVVTSSAAHFMLTGATCVISGSDSTPVIDGTHTITKLTATTFSIPVNCTVGGTVGNITTRTSASFTFTMTESNHTAAQLATALTTEFEARSLAAGLDLDYTVSYNAQTDAFTIVDDTADSTVNLQWSHASTTMARILGFSTTDSGAVTSDVSDLSPLVNGIQSISVHMSPFSDGLSTEFAQRQTDIILEIPITSVFGEVLAYFPEFESYLFDLKNLHGIINCRLSCNYNNGVGRVDLPSNSDWTMAILDVENPYLRSFLPQYSGKPGASGSFLSTASGSLEI